MYWESLQKAKKATRVHDQHEAFVQLVKQCAATVNLPEVKAVEAFYNHYFGLLNLPNDYNPAENITFRVNGQWVIELLKVCEFWASHAKQAYALEGDTKQCLAARVGIPIGLE